MWDSRHVQTISNHKYQINLGRHENNNRFLEYNILLKTS